MASRLSTLISLLHGAGDLALASHSTAVPGFPFVTSVAFATDEHHRPVMLLSRLAEHTKNLIADSRGSVLVSRQLGDGELARASIIGDVAEFEPSSLLIERYLRFHPAAEQFLQLGDFRFFRMDPIRIRVVGGFAQAGWLDGRQLLDAPHISLESEKALIEGVQPSIATGALLLSVDAYGVDYRKDELRHRVEFKTGPVGGDAAMAALRRAAKGI